MPDTFTWHAPEYKEKDRSNDWYWAVGIIALALGVIAVTSGNILFAILIVVATFTLFLFAARTPRMVEFEVSQRGVRINGQKHSYQTLESFWVHETEEPKLMIKSRKTLSPLITIPLSDDVDTENLRDLLLDYLDEEEHPESVAEKIMDHLGF